MGLNLSSLTVFDKSNTKGLSTNRFTALSEDKDGTLWIGTGDTAEDAEITQRLNWNTT